MKTSQTHPLNIDVVQVGAGEIGMTFCPGKKQRSGMSGAWHRDLDTDLDVIRSGGASALVSLIEDQEFSMLGVEDLGEKAEELGIEWFHLPITDVSIPCERFEHAWAYAGHRLRTLLEGGEKVVLHCKGGLGRTGLVAGRLMVELGFDPDSAIGLIRTARPGAIETFGYDNSQEDYVRKCGAWHGDAQWNDRVIGCLFGGAVGDAFGYVLEFMSLTSIRSRFGEQGMTKPILGEEKLIVSDDTQMTLFTLEGLLRADPQDPDDVNEQIRLAYIDWLSTQTPLSGDWRPTGDLVQERVLQENRAPGGTCIGALTQGGWGRLDRKINDSKGCGGVMRVAPLGLVRAWAPELAFNAAARAASITHGHPSGYWSAGAMAFIIRKLMDGEDLRAAAEMSLGILSGKQEVEETIKAISGALGASLTPSFNHHADLRLLGEGWVGEEALAVGLYAALVGRSFEDVCKIAANHDGDSDSTASIAGQLYGAWKGLSSLPQSWVRPLDIMQPLSRLVSGLIAMND